MGEAHKVLTRTFTDIIEGVLALSGLESFHLEGEQDIQCFIFWVKNKRPQTSELLKDLLFDPRVAVPPYSGVVARSIQELFIAGTLETVVFQGKRAEYLFSDRESIIEDLPEFFSEEEVIVLQRIAEDFRNYILLASFRRRVVEECRGL